MDYEPVFNASLTLFPSLNVSCINISVLSDSSVEAVEMFLVDVISEDEVVRITTPSAVVSITDETRGNPILI